MATSEITITIRIVSDMKGWQRYLVQYPNFVGETYVETLAREAIAAWDTEGLIVTDDGDSELITSFEIKAPA